MRSSAIRTLLPEVYRRVDRPHSPLRAILDVMETLHEPAEQVLDDLDRVFSQQRCADAFLPMLAHWTNLDQLFPEPLKGERSPWLPRALPTEPGRLRNLIARAAALSRRRGTVEGMTEFLSIATGIDGFAVKSVTREGRRNPIPFHIRVQAPATAAPQRELIERIIEHEKPAYVTYEIDFGAKEGIA